MKGNGKAIVEDAAMARDPFKGEMAGFTAVVPSVVQGNLDQALVPINSAKSIPPEQAEMMAKCAVIAPCFGFFLQTCAYNNTF